MILDMRVSSNDTAALRARRVFGTFLSDGAGLLERGRAGHLVASIGTANFPMTTPPIMCSLKTVSRFASLQQTGSYSRSAAIP